MNAKLNLKTATTDTDYLTLINIGKAAERLRISSADESELPARIKAAVSSIEDQFGFEILPKTYTWYMDSFDNSTIVLPVTPISSVTSIKYYDVDDAQQTLVEDTDYRVDKYQGRIEVISSWPATKVKVNTVEIEFVAGYTASTVPENIREAVILRLWEYYHGGDLGDLIKQSIGKRREQYF